MNRTLTVVLTAPRVLVFSGVLAAAALLPAPLRAEDQGKIWLLQDFRKKVKAAESEDVKFNTDSVEQACQDDKTSITECRRIIRSAEKDLKAKAARKESEKKQPKVVVIQNTWQQKPEPNGANDGAPCGGKSPCKQDKAGGQGTK